MKNSQICPLAGFTLIELMVAVTIALLTTGGGIVALNNFNSNQKLKSAKSQVISALKTGRDYARTNQLPSNGATLMPTGCVYVKFHNDNRVTIEGDLQTNTYSVNKIIADNGVKVVVTDEPCFALYYGKLVNYESCDPLTHKCTPIANQIKITISMTDATETGSTETVVIEPSGIINE